MEKSADISNGQVIYAAVIRRINWYAYLWGKKVKSYRVARSRILLFWKKKGIKFSIYLCVESPMLFPLYPMGEHNTHGCRWHVYDSHRDGFVTTQQSSHQHLSSLTASIISIQFRPYNPYPYPTLLSSLYSSLTTIASNTLPSPTVNLPFQLPRHCTPHITINAQTHIPKQAIISFLAEHQLMALTQSRVDFAVAGQVGSVEPAAVGFDGGGLSNGGRGGGGGGGSVGGGGLGGRGGWGGDDVEEEDVAFADGEEEPDGRGTSGRRIRRRLADLICRRVGRGMSFSEKDG